MQKYTALHIICVCGLEMPQHQNVNFFVWSINKILTKYCNILMTILVQTMQQCTELILCLILLFLEVCIKGSKTWTSLDQVEYKTCLLVHLVLNDLLWMPSLLSEPLALESPWWGWCRNDQKFALPTTKAYHSIKILFSVVRLKLWNTTSAALGSYGKFQGPNRRLAYTRFSLKSNQ